jgi:hypothetical protein
LQQPTPDSPCLALLAVLTYRRAGQAQECFISHACNHFHNFAEQSHSQIRTPQSL